jgi:RHS repeat-associated protein
MVTGATTCTNAAPAYLERFDYKATGSMVARSFTPYTDALAAPNASFAVNRADETTRHIRNGAVTITGTADPAATVKYYPTAAKPPVDAERDASGRWIAPNVPMHPMSNGLVHIQFRVDQDGQAPSFRLSEFSVNKVTTVIGNDANGSITNLPGGMGVPPLILAYDCEGNLACVSNTVSGAVSLFWYDQYSCRIAKQENGLLTLYIWDGMDIIATAHADGTIREYYTRGIGIAGDVGSLIAETRFENNAAVSTTYLHSNWRGDVVMATDASGAVVGEYAYTTFGEQLSATGTYTPRFTFSSKERDASGLVYHGFRYYSPVLCRWISEDPIREFGGINLYQFCGNNPVNSIDVDGWVDMNLFPPNEPIRRYADKAKTTDGAFSVGMHGSPTALFDATKKELAISDLAQQILRSPIYKPGQTVSLASCNAGRGGSNSNAQKLANELTKKTGIETTVKGPDSLLEYYSDGKVKPRGNGTWKIFTGKTGETK